MADLPRIYIEACPFIDMAKYKAMISLEGEAERNVWFTKQLIQAAKDGKLEAYTSSLSIAECTHISEPNTPVPSDDIKHFYDGLLASGKSGIRLVQPTLAIMERARKFRWSDGIYLKPVDTIHLASAIVMKCSEFLTTDQRILDKTSEFQRFHLRICRPSNTDLLPSEYRQGDFAESLT